MQNGIFYYFGNDKVFFTNLIQVLKNASQGSVKVERFFATQESTIQSLFLEVSKGLPDAVLIDFSLYEEDYLHLARILARTIFKKDIKIIGIMDRLKTNKVLIDAQSTGLSLNFIKSDQIKDLGEALMRLVYPDKASLPTFVKAQVDQKWECGLVSKVGFITENGIHFETNLKLSPGQIIKVEHFWRNQRLIPSKEIEVKVVHKNNIVYNYTYGVDGEFVFIDQIPELADNPQIELKEKRREQIQDSKYRYRRMFNESLSSSKYKLAKVFIVDSEFLVYQESKRSDRLPYMIRCQGTDVDLLDELNKFSPHIVVFSLNDEITNKSVESIKSWCSEQENTPYIIIFNTEQTVAEWQNLLGHKNTLASGEELSIELLMKIAKVFESKIALPSEGKDEKIFISNNREESNCQIELELDVKLLSECDIEFNSSVRIPIGSNLIITSPIKTLAYILKEEENEGVFHYEAILHSQDALDKNSLRRFINTTLFESNEVEVQDKKAILTQEIKLREILKNSQLKDE